MSSCPLEIEGIPFKSSEHLFQTLKSATPESITAVYHSNNAKMTAKHWQSIDGHRRTDWGQIVLDMMKFCLKQKYEQSLKFREELEKIRKELEKTKGYNIVELQDSKKDKDSSRANAWGVKTKGQNYEGPNLMGRLLMELRDSKMEYKLPNDWNQMLEKIGRLIFRLPLNTFQKNILKNVVKEVKHLRISKKCITFAPLCTWCGLYILKVFSLSYKKMWKFSRTRDERMTLITCVLMAENTLFINVSHPHIIQVWGLASFIIVRVIPQPSC